MKALLIIILVLSVILLIPIGVDGGYDGRSFTLYARLGLINLKVFPRKKKPKPLKAGKKLHPKKPKKPLPDKKEFLALLKMALKALGRFKRRLSVDYLRLHYTFASSDPFDAALGYGYSCAALGAALPLVENAFSIKERDFGCSVDFLSEKPILDFWVTTGIQIWEILYIAIAFGIDFLKHKLEQKKLSKETHNRKE